MHLSAQDVSVRFRGVDALVGARLEFAPGDQAVVFGPAGSGKTTLLKALAGLVKPTKGVVTWDGEDAARLAFGPRRAAQAAFGMIFQSDALFDSLTVLENVLLPLLRRGVAPEEAQTRAREALDRVGLSEALEKSPEHLSGGMKKRCGVARAIVSRPQVLLADDPFAGLDPKTEGSIASLLLEVSQGRTLIVAVPDPVASLPLPRWICLDAGRVTRDGPPWDLDAPAVAP